jgi:hypothetical protein
VPVEYDRSSSKSTSRSDVPEKQNGDFLENEIYGDYLPK